VKRLNNLILVTLLFSLTSCDVNSFLSSLQNNNSESSCIDNSSISESTNSNIDSTSVSISENSIDAENYKAQVDRTRIIYSDDFVNDPTHIINNLEIFEINDTHGAFYDENETSYIYAISRVKTVINEETIDPYAVVKIANGDLMQGSSFSNLLLGEPAVASLNEMNFDAFVIGNHEFDWGIDNLYCYKDGDLSNGELECDFLGANIVNKDGIRPDWIKPYTIVEKGNIKVGIIGLMGDGNENGISAVALNGYHFSDSVEAAKTYTKELKENKGVDIVIIAVHGHEEDINQKYANECEVDAIINAHDHYRIEEWVTRKKDFKKIPVIESNTKNLTIGKITLQLENKKFNSYTMEHFYCSDYDKDPNLDNIMCVYYSVVENYQNTIIGYRLRGFSKEEIGISTCNYIAVKYQADLAVTNSGGVRAKISSGDITYGNMFEVYPFDNELYIAYLTGREIKRCFQEGYYFNDTGIGKGTYLNDSKIDNNKTYKVVTVDYVATKEYMLDYFDDNHGLVKTGDYIRDCAIENIKKNFKK